MRNLRSISYLMCATAAGLAAPAAAEPFVVKPLLDLRLRHEFVDQDGLAREAGALTGRARMGFEAASGPFRLLAETEATKAFDEGYFSGLNGRSTFPLVADPENLELNRLQLQYRFNPNAVVTAGRQRINLEDQRFVGSVGWRQNEQTFDTVRLEYGTPKGLKADLIYAGAVRTIWGEAGRGARQTSIDGDNIFAMISHPSPAGTLTGFAVFVDQEEPAVSLYQQSSKTIGARLAGVKTVGSGAKLSYAFSYASQRDHARNPNDYRASYLLTEAGLELGAARFGLGREVLGADDGRVFTSFQTPLATLHKFQGWADKFLVTPPNGIRDLYASAGCGWKKVLGLDAVIPTLVYHRYRSDRLGIPYGNELNASLAAKKGRWTVTAKYAGYDARRFATDTRKGWLQLEFAY